uniref:Transporter (inferred by orthology to a C. elegans protein) n=1 Tax=Strongyloides venezuelensis TaxID=75913 RepID=A0A0K0F7D0_STRVS
MSVNISESSDSSNSDWHSDLRHQIEELANKNENLKQYSFLGEKTKKMDQMITELRHKAGDSEVTAAQYHLKCLRFLDDMVRIVNQQTIKSKLRTLSARRKTIFQSQDSTGSNPPTDRSFNSSAYFYGPRKFDKRNNKNEEPKIQIRNNFLRLVCGLTEEDLNDDSHSDNGAEQDKKHVRDLWSTQITFFLSCLGFIIGVGNTLRFPSMIYEYGGGVFFIPYIIFLILFGFPLVYMHLCIGQYSGLSASGAFSKMMPAASGIGWGLVILAIPVCIYYNIIIAWSLYYFWYAITSPFSASYTDLAWNHCQKDWVLDHSCCDIKGDQKCFLKNGSMTSSEAFFHFEVLNRTLANNPSLGDVQMHTLICLAVAWILVYIGVSKGIGSIGWAVSITATIPYLLCLILLLRGISLPGSEIGLRFLFTADFSRLKSISLWKAAAEQVFYSLGIDAGPLISMASFSRYRNNIYRDAALLVILDTLTSILCGTIIFSFCGFLAKIQSKELTDILKLEPLYISYTVYPGITSFMEWGSFWAALFFGMLTLSALDGEFAWLEMIASSIMNLFGFKEHKIESRLHLFMCLLFFLLGIPLTCRGGIFIFHALEKLNANWNAFSLSLIQVILVCYVYGVDKFQEDIREMLRITDNYEDIRTIPYAIIRKWKEFKLFAGPTGNYIKYSWSIFSPLILSFLLIASIWRYERVTFSNRPLPIYYELIAWISMVGPLIIVPIIFFYHIKKLRREGKKLSYIFDTSNWRAEDDDASSEYSDEKNNDNFSSIDPISRNVSVKSNVFPSTSVIAQRIFRYPPHVPPSTIQEETGSHISGEELLNGPRFKKNSSFSTITETKKTVLESIISSKNEKIEEEENISEHSNRITGRLADWLEKNEQQPKLGIILFPKSETNSTIMHDIISDKVENTGILFGPPPEKSSIISSSLITPTSTKFPQENSKKDKCAENNHSFNLQTPSEKASPKCLRKKLSKQNKINEEGVNALDGTNELNNYRDKIHLQNLAYEKNITNVNIDDNSELAKSLLSKKEEISLKTKQTIKLKRPKPIETPVKLI